MPYLYVGVENSKQQEKTKVIYVRSQFSSGVRREQSVFHSSLIMMCNYEIMVVLFRGETHYQCKLFDQVCFKHAYMEY